MIIKTTELEGAAIDWAVAKAINMRVLFCTDRTLRGDYIDEPWEPSINWAQGGPLIEQYKAEFRARGGSYECRIEMWDGEGIGYDEIKMIGADHLTAAMRVIVAAELGDTVDIPAELCQ